VVCVLDLKGFNDELAVIFRPLLHRGAYESTDQQPRVGARGLAPALLRASPNHARGAGGKTFRTLNKRGPHEIETVYRVSPGGRRGC